MASVLALLQRPQPSFGLTAELLREILEHARPLGHNEDAASLNLGFGFVYYGLVRSLRPEHVVVIGSGFGFSVVCLALGLKDNGRGRLSFVDPSYSVLADGPLQTLGGTAQWSDPERVRRHFARFGVESYVRHFRARSEEFFAGFGAFELPPIDLAFIDGNHSYEDVRHDFLACARHARKNAYFLLHDTNIYIREWLRHAGVKRWMRGLRRRRELVEVVDFPFSSGVAIVRLLRNDAWRHLSSPESA